MQDYSHQRLCGSSHNRLIVRHHYGTLESKQEVMPPERSCDTSRLLPSGPWKMAAACRGKKRKTFVFCQKLPLKMATHRKPGRDAGVQAALADVPASVAAREPPSK